MVLYPPLVAQIGFDDHPDFDFSGLFACALADEAGLPGTARRFRSTIRIPAGLNGQFATHA